MIEETIDRSSQWTVLAAVFSNVYCEIKLRIESIKTDSRNVELYCIVICLTLGQNVWIHFHGHFLGRRTAGRRRLNKRNASCRIRSCSYLSTGGHAWNESRTCMFGPYQKQARLTVSWVVGVCGNTNPALRLVQLNVGVAQRAPNRMNLQRMSIRSLHHCCASRQMVIRLDREQRT
jgi:hypothetical protein